MHVLFLFISNSHLFCITSMMKIAYKLCICHWQGCIFFFKLMMILNSNPILYLSMKTSKSGSLLASTVPAPRKPVLLPWWARSPYCSHTYIALSQCMLILVGWNIKTTCSVCYKKKIFFPINRSTVTSGTISFLEICLDPW